jgi:hypothetical protein
MALYILRINNCPVVSDQNLHKTLDHCIAGWSFCVLTLLNKTMYLNFNDRTTANLEQLKAITGKGIVHLLNVAVHDLLQKQLTIREQEHARKDNTTNLQL